MTLKPIAVTLIGLILSFVSLHSAFATDNAVNTATQSDDTYSLYLIRHAEKQIDKTDPALTNCGMQRSEQYAKDFKAISLDAIYSSDYRRTQQTAAPTAKQKQLPISSYDPKQLEAIAKQLLSNKQSALVVGHSNTTGVLAGILTGQKLTEFSEQEYDRVYVVEINNGQGTLTLTRQKFNCANIQPLEK
ncbi:SixA phosphatase family protein [Thalassotalea litorea]|nr:phosphoglycerate mutase family protein [Thalassotalea litorea]